jgi:hypothetical protein
VNFLLLTCDLWRVPSTFALKCPLVPRCFDTYMISFDRVVVIAIA